MAVYEDMGLPVGNLARMAQAGGAVASLALMVGVGVWGAGHVMRDVSGVPVVRAMDGEMRRAPDHSGGQIADHTNLSVNEIAARGEAAGPEDVLLLAPAGADLAEEDLEVATVADTDPTVVEIVPDTGTAASGPMTAEEVLALADRLAADTTPLGATDEAAADAPVAEVMRDETEDLVALALAEALAEPDAGPAIDARITTTLRPALRPARGGLRPEATLAPAVMTADEAVLPTQAALTREMPLPSQAALTDDLPVGTKLVQLGAFPNPEEAQAEWRVLQARFAEFMGDKQQVIQEASTGGSTFYRLRAAGFEDLADARRFCATLDAARTACIPVIVR